VLSLRSPEELKREIAERQRAQAALEKAHIELENRVRARTFELSRTNALLKEQIQQRERAETERARLLAREQAARAEAEAANRTKDEFLATLSHELRTPLNSMLGWTRMLRQENLPPATVQRGLETIERNVKVQTQLINDLLDVSRIIRGKLHLELSYIDLAPVMEAAIDAIRPAAAAKEIRLEVLLEPLAGPVAADFDRLQQVVWNLLSNAIKFTPRGGRVQVRLERVHSQVEMSIADTGPGISPEFLPHVFERFRQADSKITRAHSGLGLGLAIVRHLVELHGGTVAAESPGEGKGATFRVRLPIRAVHLELDSSDPETGGREEDAVATAASLDGLRLLVVDDEPDAREVVALVLEQSGAEVAAFGTAQEALEAIESVRPDVLVSDIGMPGEDGYSLLRRVRALGPARGGQVPAVALTAYAKVEDRKRALASGFARHIPKPVEPADLIATVAKLAGLPARRDRQATG
ncbi:MAG: response regulator, partial [Planctomycetes bacterium]|nr:response regulator [Planctomycetota bacterium]